MPLCPAGVVCVLRVAAGAADALRQVRAAGGERGGAQHAARRRRGRDRPRVRRGAEGRAAGPAKVFD